MTWFMWGFWIICALIASVLCKTGERGFYDFLTLIILITVLDFKYGRGEDG